jgi:hypothetical protein
MPSRIAQRAAGASASVRRLFVDAFPAMALGAGLALGNALAVLEGLFGRGVVFERTPKRGARAMARAPRYRSPATRTAYLELGLLAYLLASKAVAGHTRWGEVPFLAFFTFGLLAMSVPSLHEAWRVDRTAPRRVRP